MTTNTTVPQSITAQVRSLNMLPNIEIEGATKAILNLDMARPFVPQVQDYLRNLGDARGFKNVGVVGQAVAALIILPALEMLGGLPVLTFKGFGPDGATYQVDAADYRHNQVRSRRAELAKEPTFEGYTVLDGSGRGLTPAQLTELAAILGVEESAIRTINLDMGQVNFSDVSEGMADKVISSGVTFGDLTSGRCLFLPGGAGIVAAFMGLTIYGLGEAWTRVIRLNKGEDNAFHVAELVDCQAQRQFGVKLTAEIAAAIPAVTVSGQVPDEFRKELADLAAKHGVEVRG